MRTVGKMEDFPLQFRPTCHLQFLAVIAPMHTYTYFRHERYSRVECGVAVYGVHKRGGGDLTKCSRRFNYTSPFMLPTA